LGNTTRKSDRREIRYQQRLLEEPPEVLIGASRKILRREKPWGEFEQYTHNLTSTVKIITVAPGGTLSSQYHHHRDELWVVLDPGAGVEMDGETLSPQPGEKLYIPRGTVHRLSAEGEKPVRILEISFGEFDEGDIVRLDDVYGRAGSDEDAGNRHVRGTYRG
jgi:mannose-1-phosphate guanylyltransferase/mannose-6-phosphate isomerase